MVIMRNGNDLLLSFSPTFFRHARPLTIFPPRIFGRVSFPLSEWYPTACYSMQSYPVGNYDDMKRRAFFLFSFPSSNIQQAHRRWMDTRADKPVIYLSRKSSISLLPRPRPLTNLHKHLDTPHSPPNFNLAILIFAPGASNFTSSL